MAARLRQGPVGRAFGVSTNAGAVRTGQRTLAALNLNGLGRIEALGAGLVAAVGVAVLGAFVVLERRREFAILRAIGADTSQVLTGPAQEGAIVALGSLLLGIPIGLGLGALAVRVLNLFFTLPPPALSVPVGALAAYAALILGASAIALGAALAAINRIDPAAVLREM